MTKGEEAARVFERLVASADILITNIRGGALEKLGLQYEQDRPLRAG